MLAEMESGQVLRIVATDEGSKDFPAFCRQTGNGSPGAKEVPAADRKEFEFLVMRK